MLKTGIIGRSEWMYFTLKHLINEGIKISFILTSKEAPEYKFEVEDFRLIAAKNNIPFLNTSKVNSKDAIKFFNENKAEIVLSVNYTGIISQKIINLFPLGILNAHGGDLPRYRGNACQAWAIINEEKKIGLCIHKMIGGELDSGDIIAKSYLDIDVNTSISKVYEWMENKVPELMFNAIEKLNNNPKFILETQSKNPKHALRCYPRRPEDGKINWNFSAVNILRLINASSEPFSGAFCNYENDKIIIWRAEIFTDNENYLAIPGQVSLIDHQSNCIIVITGNGKLKITEIEYQGDRCNPNTIIKSIRKRLL